MLQQEPHWKTAFQKKVAQRWVHLLVTEVLQDETLGVLLSHTCYLLATQRFPDHPTAKNHIRQVTFAAFTRGLRAKREELPPWEADPHMWEHAMLRILSEQIRTRLPALYAVFEEDDQLPNALRHVACLMLADTASSEPSRKGILEFANAIPLAFVRVPDNPIRFTYNAETGQLDGKDLHLVSPKHLREIGSLRRIYAPRKVGRRSGQQKPKQSGRAPLPVKESLAVFQAIEGDGKDWKYCARTILKKKIPSEHKERERLRAYVGRLKHNGSLL